MNKTQSQRALDEIRDNKLSVAEVIQRAAALRDEIVDISKTFGVCVSRDVFIFELANKVIPNVPLKYSPNVRTNGSVLAFKIDTPPNAVRRGTEIQFTLVDPVCLNIHLKNNNLHHILSCIKTIPDVLLRDTLIGIMKYSFESNDEVLSVFPQFVYSSKVKYQDNARITTIVEVSITPALTYYVDITVLAKYSKNG